MVLSKKYKYSSYTGKKGKRGKRGKNKYTLKSQKVKKKEKKSLKKIKTKQSRYLIEKYVVQTKLDKLFNKLALSNKKKFIKQFGKIFKRDTKGHYKKLIKVIKKYNNNMLNKSPIPFPKKKSIRTELSETIRLIGKNKSSRRFSYVGLALLFIYGLYATNISTLVTDFNKHTDNHIQKKQKISGALVEPFLWDSKSSTNELYYNEQIKEVLPKAYKYIEKTQNVKFKTKYPAEKYFSSSHWAQMFEYKHLIKFLEDMYYKYNLVINQNKFIDFVTKLKLNWGKDLYNNSLFSLNIDIEELKKGNYLVNADSIKNEATNNLTKFNKQIIKASINDITQNNSKYIINKLDIWLDSLSTLKFQKHSKLGKNILNYIHRHIFSRINVLSDDDTNEYGILAGSNLFTRYNKI